MGDAHFTRLFITLQHFSGSRCGSQLNVAIVSPPPGCFSAGWAAASDGASPLMVLGDALADARV